jgi:hypothetical protein
VRLVLVVLLLLVSEAAARAALRRTRVPRLARSVVPVPPAQKATLLINPRSGSGRADRHRLVDQCLAMQEG